MGLLRRAAPRCLDNPLAWQIRSLTSEHDINSGAKTRPTGSSSAAAAATPQQQQQHKDEHSPENNSSSKSSSSDPWSHHLSHSQATEMVSQYDKLHTNSQHTLSLGKGMPSSVMRRLDIMFFSDIRRRRQRHGRRARVLAVLSELRLLIQTQTEAEGDRSGRVFRYLDELNRLYVDVLQADARPLQLRAGTSVTLQQYRAGGEDGDCVTLAVGSSTRPQVAVRMTEYDRGRAGAPALLCSLYAKQELRQQRRAGTNSSIDAVDPVKPSWIDYLVSDLAPAEARALFTLISRSKVPDNTSQLLRAAAEEALVFALNRHGAALEPLQSMRVCTYFLRRQCGHAQVRQLQRVWELAGDSIEAQQAAGSNSLGDLRFKRWNNVASQLLVFLSGPGNDVPGAWRLLAHWHTVWTRVMRRLCPVARRPDEAPDGLRFPYWRAKRPGIIRLHDLTLSSPAVTRLLAVLVRDNHMACALELLGIATSEAGVRLCAAPFNVLLRGISDRDALQPDAQRMPAYALPSLASQLPLLANSRALTAYALSSDPAADRPTAQMLLLLRAMMRWRLDPDACTLGIIVRLCCRAGDLRALCAALRLFAATWRVRPSEHCWRIIDEAGMYDDARSYFENKVEPLLLSVKSSAVHY